MSTIQVQSPGMFTTVQDLGRYGYGPLGVSPSGAGDPLALRVGNLLVGNLESAAALEMTLLGGTFVFPEGAIVALAGADFSATVDGSPLAPWTACELSPGATLRTGGAQSGARCYLCVRGGIEVKPLLGSASTHILTGLGGFAGRPLKRGDVLRIGRSAGTPRVIRPAELAKLAPRKILRATDGPQTGWFSRASLDRFFGGAYQVTGESNRMGLRLEGPALETPHSGQMISEGVSLGAIQVPAGGKPIILFVEQQTTGGYPKIANVISADLPSIGQLRPRDEIRFEHVEPAAARALIRQQEEFLISGALFQ
ncbi:MAG TPA: biotin-dependent carboxyltransferase family protein [Bryobacteraceae bacterium]|jgi:antagonist of KipI|nr:biotin-dependent carboxyltransferase family protein [Bryobacteraceae bacterium]